MGCGAPNETLLTLTRTGSAETIVSPQNHGARMRSRIPQREPTALIRPRETHAPFPRGKVSAIPESPKEILMQPKAIRVTQLHPQRTPKHHHPNHALPRNPKPTTATLPLTKERIIRVLNHPRQRPQRQGITGLCAGTPRKSTTTEGAHPHAITNKNAIMINLIPPIIKDPPNSHRAGGRCRTANLGRINGESKGTPGTTTKYGSNQGIRTERSTPHARQDR
jgi:hypothetical protein